MYIVHYKLPDSSTLTRLNINHEDSLPDLFTLDVFLSSLFPRIVPDLTVDHQSKCISVTVEHSPSRVPNRAPLR
jgi:hypothetical protein